MKKRKAIISLLLAIVMVLAMTACSSNQNQQTSEEETQPTQEPILVGTITDASMNTITVKNNSGNEYTFSTEGAEMDIRNGIELGNWVEINYSGDLGDGSRTIQATKVVDDSDNIKQEQEQVEITAEEATMYATASVHVRTSYTTASDILATLKQAERVSVTGKSNNGWFRIDYKGKDGYVSSSYLSEDRPSKNSSATAPTKPKASASKETAYGIITYADGATMTFNIDGVEYNCETILAKIKLKKGIVEGEKVKITYSGDLAKHPTIIKVEDSDQ